jgi:uncharacterized membrane protein YwzB
VPLFCVLEVALLGVDKFMKKVVNTVKLLLLFVAIFISSQLVASMLSSLFHISGDVGFMIS